ncbi:hypothetical protein [Planomicrobium sp. CPCC 101110]|uniref:hypothetical protein n=1 Tax=Planomicrobium sp. CPCC 101110 TaxID=2599619 RepID=UPI0011B83C28|nr:hypothetical protein [Planomicrobium sp. CPCC 101110]TWT25306.1 hypothetical protein FQV30_13160 [Planomicrobium sp. CPCC 101110]
MTKYWEAERPVVKKSEKNVVKVFREQGKVQVFPRVEGSRHGIGRGAILDLVKFAPDELLELKSLIVEAFNQQIHRT